MGLCIVRRYVWGQRVKWNDIDVIRRYQWVVVAQWRRAATLPPFSWRPPPTVNNTTTQSAFSAETRSVPCRAVWRVVCWPSLACCVSLVLWSFSLCIQEKVNLAIFLFSSIEYYYLFNWCIFVPCINYNWEKYIITYNITYVQTIYVIRYCVYSYERSTIDGFILFSLYYFIDYSILDSSRGTLNVA